jgi:hypothetical protein
VQDKLDAFRERALGCEEYCTTKVISTDLKTLGHCAKLATNFAKAVESDSQPPKPPGGSQTGVEDVSARSSSEYVSSQADTVCETLEDSNPQKAAQPQPDAQPGAQLEEQPAASFGLQYLLGAFFGLLYWAWPFNAVEWRRETGRG